MGVDRDGNKYDYAEHKRKLAQRFDDEKEAEAYASAALYEQAVANPDILKTIKEAYLAALKRERERCKS